MNAEPRLKRIMTKNFEKSTAENNNHGKYKMEEELFNKTNQKKTNQHKPNQNPGCKKSLYQEANPKTDYPAGYLSASHHSLNSITFHL